MSSFDTPRKKRSLTSPSPSKKKSTEMMGSKRGRESDKQHQSILMINLQQEDPASVGQHETTTTSDEWNPRNELESRLLQQIRAQKPWFKKREILGRIRRMKPDTPITTESVIAELKLYRQVMEEARQMDQARLLSEQEHDQEDAMRRKSKEQTMRSSCFQEWKSNFFASSWILESTGSLLQPWVEHSSELRAQVLRLLSLEQKAHQWYSGLCRAHFIHVICPAILQSTTTPPTTATTTTTSYRAATSLLLCCITNEADRIERAMFRLSEQSGGVPRLFREAHDAAHVNDVQAEDDDEDQVLVLRTTSPPEKKSRGDPIVVGDTSLPPTVLEIL